MSAPDIVTSSLELPNGSVVPNRLVKVAMEEGIGYGGGLPDHRHRELYRRWGEGGWGILISGNVQVDPQHLATPHDRTIPSVSHSTISAYSALRVSAISSINPGSPVPLMIMQISHAGLQSSSTIGLSRLAWVPAVGPSSTRPDAGSSAYGWILGRVLWPRKSRKIVDFREWEEIVKKFVDAAIVAERAGWEGVQVHSAHGYLLAEYLSPLTNPHCIPLPGVYWKIPVRLHLLYLILKGIQQATAKSFIKAIKINCSDFVQGGLDEEQSAEIIKEIVTWKMVDILEVSGGNYSSPAFATLKGKSSSRQSLFSHFTSALLPHLPRPPEGPAIILTGGIHSRDLIRSSLETRACDLVGIGRPACLVPALPRDIVFNKDIPDDEANFGGYEIPGGERMKALLGGGSSRPEQPAIASYAETETAPLLSMSKTAGASKQRQGGIPLVGAGVSTFWHEWQMCRLARGVEPDEKMNWVVGLIWEGVVWAFLGVIIGFFRQFRQ